MTKLGNLWISPISAYLLRDVLDKTPLRTSVNLSCHKGVLSATILQYFLSQKMDRPAWACLFIIHDEKLAMCFCALPLLSLGRNGWLCEILGVLKCTRPCSGLLTCSDTYPAESRREKMETGSPSLAMGRTWGAKQWDQLLLLMCCPGAGHWDLRGRSLPWRAYNLEMSHRGNKEGRETEAGWTGERCECLSSVHLGRWQRGVTCSSVRIEEKF